MPGHGVDQGRRRTGAPEGAGSLGPVTPPPPSQPRPLRVSGCRRLCRWAATAQSRAGEPLFACCGCGSEWVPSEAWTPIDHTGAVPEAVQRERGRGGR